MDSTEGSGSPGAAQGSEAPGRAQRRASDGNARPRTPQRSPFRSVLRLRNFRRLWIGLGVSSLGDWIGLFALISVTNRLAPGNTLAIAGLMIFRVLPAFVIGPLAGVMLDRLDRRKAMIVCDITRALLIASIPFVSTLPVLYAISFTLETIALVWMPAKDALIPSLVPNRWLVAANSLALMTTYGVIPLGAIAFTGLVSVAEFLGGRFDALAAFGVSQENLALWLNTLTFLVAAFMVSRIDFPGLPRNKRKIRLGVLVEEVVEGLRYLKERGEVTRVIRGIAFALVGGAVVFSLGAPYVTEVLQGGPRGFGAMLSVAGSGMGLGLVVLGLLGDRLPKAWVFALAILACGCGLVVAATLSGMATALVLVTILGAFAGMAYATGFALIQERVDDRLRGRTFASLQVVIRSSLFVSLITFPALANLFAAIPAIGTIEEGIRLSMALAGLVVIAAGTLTARDVYRRRIGG